MSLSLSQLFPGIEAGLNSIGFLFGAGTSKEAGFPLMQDLTKTVVENLSPRNKKTLNDILNVEGLDYDAATGEPNIEVLSDYVTKRLVTTQDNKYNQLEDEIRKSIVETILNVKDPDLTHHIQFLNALKKRAAGTSATVTILTTNYDILFELAAGEAEVRLETGFDGPLRRIFDPAVFDLKRGEVKNSRFSERHELCINFLKLHGSVSWLKRNDGITESGIDLLNTDQARTMVLPRRQKVIETLSPPYDQLFTRASRMLGSTCKYLVSCGFSFNDQHINDQLIVPKLQEGNIRLTALCGEESKSLDIWKKFQAFHAGFPANCYIDGTNTGEGTEIWKFSQFVQLLKP